MSLKLVMLSLDKRGRKSGHWIVAIILLVLVLLAIRIRIKNVEVMGAETYSDEEAVNLVFEDYWDSNTFICFINNLLGRKKDLPFIADYSIVLTGPFSCDLIIYEKSPVGCIYYMDSYMYFDRDGIIIESSQERIEGAPVIEGIDFGHIVLGEKLPIENDDVFADIMIVTEQLDINGIGCDTIYFDELMEITITITGGDIRVELGTNENISSKIIALHDMLPELIGEGLKGTLYLSNYGDSTREKSVSFRIDYDTQSTP